MVNAWRIADVKTDTFLAAASHAFLSHRYLDTTLLYRTAALVKQVPDREKFQWSIAKIMLQQDLSDIPEPQVLHINELDEILEIKGSAFQWMLDRLLGQSIGNPTAGDPRMGYLSFNGRAIAAINVRAASTYTFTIRVYHNSPSPVQLQLEIDFLPVADFELSAGDGSLTTTRVKDRFGCRVAHCRN